MYISLGVALIVGLVLGYGGATLFGPVGAGKVRNARLEVNAEAPDFRLRDHTGRTIQLSDYLGKKNVVLARFEAVDTQVLGITVDSMDSNAAWVESLGVENISVLSDYWPHGQVAQSYGVLREHGMTERAIFIVDKEGIIRYIDIHDFNSQPDNEVLFEVLEGLE